MNVQNINTPEDLLSVVHNSQDLYVYGAGFYCHKILEILSRNGISVPEAINAILVSNAEGNPVRIEDIEVRQINDEALPDGAVIIMAIQHQFHKDVFLHLQDKDVTVVVLDFNLLDHHAYEDVAEMMSDFARHYDWNSLCEEYRYAEQGTQHDNYAFTLWWQGLDEAPEIVKSCIASQRRSLPPEVKQIIITGDNYRDWMKLPDEICDKVQRQQITLTTLSDIIRAELLHQYGGAWFDATLLVTKPINSELFTYPIYTRNIPETQFCTRAMWAGFYVFTMRKYPLYCFVKDAFYWYFAHYETIKYYLMIDYFTALACNLCPLIEKDLQNVPFNNEKTFEMSKHLQEPYEEGIYKRLLSAAEVHKLTYKIAPFNQKGTILDAIIRDFG